MREEEFFLGRAGCALFMMQYAMLITLHIPKWKNCFKQKKRTKYDRFHRMYIFALYLKFKLKKKSSKYNINICINIRKVFTVLPCYSCRFNRDTGLWRIIFFLKPVKTKPHRKTLHLKYYPYVIMLFIYYWRER